MSIGQYIIPKDFFNFAFSIICPMMNCGMTFFCIITDGLAVSHIESYMLVDFSAFPEFFGTPHDHRPDTRFFYPIPPIFFKRLDASIHRALHPINQPKEQKNPGHIKITR